MIGLLLTAFALATPQGDAPSEVLGLVRSVSGRPVAGAEVTFLPDPGEGLPWLGARAEDAPPAVGSTGENGRFRFESGFGVGTLVVQHPDGLGAVLPAVSAGRAAQVVARPLAEVSFADDDAFRGHFRLLRGDAEPGAAIAREGAAVRLPAGEWLLLAERNDGALVEHRLSLQPGQRLELPAPSGVGPRLDPPGAGERCRLARWPTVRLDRRLPVLSGPAVLIARSRGPGGATAFADVWIEEGASTVEVPATEAEWRTVAVAGPDARVPAGTVVRTVAAMPGGAVVRSTSRPGDDGTAVVRVDPPIVPAEVLVVGQAPGHAVTAMRLAELDQGATLQLDTAAPLVFGVLGHDGAPVAGAMVLVRSERHPILDRVLITDANGLVVVPHVAGDSVAVEVRHAEHLPADTIVERDSERTPIVTLEPGGRVIGLVLWSDNSPAPSIAVELRDATGVLGVEPRFATSGLDGTFLFEGLPDGVYVVFANAVRDGVTWSGRSRVWPGPDEWHVVLRNEDPALPGRRED